MLLLGQGLQPHPGPHCGLVSPAVLQLPRKVVERPRPPCRLPPPHPPPRAGYLTSLKILESAPWASRALSPLCADL